MTRQTEGDVPFWAQTPIDVVVGLASSTDGLSAVEAHRRTRTAAAPLAGHHVTSMVLLGRQFRNPIVLLLVAAAIVSWALGEGVDSGIIIAVVVLSAALGYLQERGAVRAVDALLASVRVHADVLRDGVETQVTLEEVVTGDVVVLRAGDVVPGDCLVLAATQLQADESSLTGESFPRAKAPGRVDASTPVAARSNCVHLGTHIVSGEGRAVVVRTGRSTEFGHVVGRVAEAHVPTAFERGTTDFGLLILRATTVLVVAVLAVNLLTGRSAVESFLFSLALAVGLTPQMLPAIITLTLSRGAVYMGRRGVIVKRLDAIENVGSLDVLFTDKTGTITEGTLVVRGAVDHAGERSVSVLRLARLNARLQSGFLNPIDRAILETGRAQDDDDADNVARCSGEVPYDFERKRLSVRVDLPEGTRFIMKGAVKEVLSCCTTVETGIGHAIPIDEVRDRVEETFRSLSADGFRVLAVATRPIPTGAVVPAESLVGEEHDMSFVGFLFIEDPPKKGVEEAIVRLRALGVDTRMITGDNRFVAAHVARAVGIRADRILTGDDISTFSDEEMISIVDDVAVFAETSPLEKEKIVRAVCASGRTVGYLGDGINDAPSLRAADVGVSVDGAVDVAKQTADLVMLEKNLGVLADGITTGRRVFANTLKYVWVTISANFGNMLSLAIATPVLPFLPLLPTQILLLNFLSDIPALAIAADRVDDEQAARPVSWDIRGIRNFMIVFGAVSSVFNLLTFFIVHRLLGGDAVMTRTAWFVESTLTELLAMLILRTRRPAMFSRPATGLLVASACIGAMTIALPWSPVAHVFGFIGMTRGIGLTVTLLALGYAVTTEVVKRSRLRVFTR